jgi:hypothetical protein
VLPPAEQGGVPHRPLGLQFEVVSSGQHANAESSGLRVRPVTVGRQGTTGVSWREDQPETAT